MNLATRRAGVLLHPTSLPSGTLDDAERWLDWLADTGFGVWQMLPLGVPLVAGSPYQCASAFAMNPAFAGSAPCDADACAVWCEAEAGWLDDYALFMAIKSVHDGAAWTAWPRPLRDREPGALAAFAAAHAATLETIKQAQARVALRWRAVREAATARDIQLFGDLPLFVAHDSADVWAYRAGFRLDAAGEPTVVAGVPPDYFSASGQRWGNPHYDWAAMAADGYRWWRARMQAHTACFDLVRIDHFRGLAAAWAIPASAATAVEGEWVDSPGEALLAHFAADAGGVLPVVAEDLGIITPDVVALKNRFGLPGMSVLQFAFDDHADNPHKPENVTEATVYYTGTHDNDTTVGWWQALDETLRTTVAARLGLAAEAPAGAVRDAMVDTVLASRAALAVLPLQDVLGLDGAARMNTPGTVEGNWQWRFDWPMLDPLRARDLAARIQTTQRWRTAPL